MKNGTSLRLRNGLLLLQIVVLSACQHQSQVMSSQSDWRNDELPFVSAKQNFDITRQWQYRAKVGITSKQVRQQARLVWQYGDQSNRVSLFGPLGVGAIKLEFDQFGVQLSDNKGIVHEGRSAERLLTEIIGWPIPIDALAYWLFVLPEPEFTFQYRLNNDGQVAAIRQLGWEISFTDYRQYGDRFLPRKLSAIKQFENSEQGTVSVKLITKLWQWGVLE